jgi:hypothetical protein
VNPHTEPNSNLTIQFIKVANYNNRYSKKKTIEKTNKYEALINNIKAKRWKADPILVITTGARWSIHKQTTTNIKTLYKIPKNLIKPMISKININAIKYAMHILLHKRRLENKQPLPIIQDPP